MTDPIQTDATPPPTGYKAPLLLAGSGAAAGFCAASCCGLPVLLGSLGLGSGWLVTLAWFAAPHRIALLIAAGVLLVGGAGVFWWRRRVAYCVVGASTARWPANILLTGILFVGVALAVLGSLYG